MSDFEYIEVSRIHVSATPGSPISYCLREAIKLAATEWQNVTLLHNGIEYNVNCNDLAATVDKPVNRS